MQSLVSLHPAIIVAAFCVAAAFCVTGLMIQHEAEKQRRIAERVRDERDERRADRLRHSRRAARLSTPLQAYPVPLAGVLDGGAPLAGSVVLVDRSPDRPMDRPTLRQVTGQSTASTPATSPTPSTPSIPDESTESDADSEDISTQTTQKLPVAVRRARPVPPPIPPKILEAMGGRWLRALPWTLPDDARK